MRILHIIDHFAVGGGQLPIPLNIVKHIDQNKFECIVCTLRSNKTKDDYSGNIVTLNYSKWDPRTFFALPKLCKKNNIDIIHVHLQKSIISALLANFFYKKPIIVHEHGEIFEKKFNVYNILLRILHKNACKIIAVSNATKDELIHKIPATKNKIDVIYNAIDFQPFKMSNKNIKEIKQKYSIPNNCFVIGFVGRLHQVKRIDLLIKAFKLLLKNSTNSILLIAGDGPEQSRLNSLIDKLDIRKNIRMLGTCNNVPEVMSICDVGVIPSEYESFGRVAIEFMRANVPVVCSGKGGLKELVINEITGLITFQNTPEEICAGIEKILRNKVLRENIIKKAYSFSENFEIHKQVHELEKLYVEIYNQSNSKA